MGLVVRMVCGLSRLGSLWQWRRVVLLAAIGWSYGGTGELRAAPSRWKTGVEFTRTLDARVGQAVWSAGTPLRQALTSLADSQALAIMLDRRIDPSSGIELSVRDVPVREVLALLAAQCGAVPAYLEGVVYVGPRAVAVQLATVAQERRVEAQQLPRATARRLTAARAWRWEELAEPRALVQQLAREAEITIDDGVQLPHDLWAAKDLPELVWTDRMTLVLAGFGLTFAFEDGGRSLRLTPFPEPALVTRKYPAILTAPQLESLKTQFPGAVIDGETKHVEFSGTADEHQRLQALLQHQVAGRPPRRKAGETVLTLKVTSQPVRAILTTLERQLGVTFQMEAGLEEPLRTRVSFDVQQASLPELLDAALTPAGLSHRQRGDVIVIETRPRE